MSNQIRGRRVAVGATVLAGAIAFAGVAGAAAVRFSDFTPLAASAGPTANEATPITFGNPAFQQRSIADRDDAARRGRAQQRRLGHDHRQRDRSAQGRLPVHAVRDAASPASSATTSPPARPRPSGTARPPAITSRFDASYWTPWGTYITAEESWCTAPTGCTTSPYGRLFELTNPLTADSVTDRRR